MAITLLTIAMLAVLAAACSEPPYKEMHQAQGALDAARAVGAETFANAEYRDAQLALDQSQQAVAQRDYRLALRYALDARERAQDAARAAADHKAEARVQAERAMMATETAIRGADARLQAARIARAKPRDILPARNATDAAREALQKARAAMEKEAYLEVPGMLAPAQTQLADALRDLTAKETTRPPARPARRRR